MSLQLEMRAYLHRLARPDPFLGGTGKALAPGTVHQYRLVFIQLASALVASGMPIGEITSLRTLVTPSNVRTALTFFHARAGERVTHQIHMLAYRAQRIARDLGGQSEEVLRELADISATIKGQAPKRFGLAEKNRRLLEHMEDPAFVDRLVMLPDRLLQAAERATGKDAASRARDAVAIEILLTCGMRVGNLVDLRIGDTIRAYGQGRDARWVIEIPAEKVKNGQPLRFTLPKESGQLIELYLKKWHPYYGGAASPWLLPSKAGGHMDPHYLSRSIATQARRHVGVAISCHQFRHLTAELYLRQDPTGIGIVSQHLGHRSINTTRNYYAREQTRVATQRYHEVLSRTRAAVPSRMRVRKESPPRPGPR